MGGAGGRVEAGRGAGPGLLGTGGHCRSGYTTYRLPTNIYSPKGIPRAPKFVRFYLMLLKMSPSWMWKPYLPLSLILLYPESPEQLTGWHAMHYTLSTDKLPTPIRSRLLLVNLRGLHKGHLQMRNLKRR